MDYYRILGINKNATPEEIKKAYRKLASIHHPDKGGSKEEFQKIEEAYRTLSDSEKRNQYDNPVNNFGSNPFNHAGFNPFEDIFREFHFRTTNQHRPPQARIYTINVFITLEKAALGGSEKIQIQGPQGSRLIDIQIPQGIEDGQQIRYDNLMPDGALQVSFRVHNHPMYERRGLDLYTKLNISIFDLILGTTVNFATIFGQNLEVRINPKTQPGTSLRLSGHGMKVNNVQGNQYILISAVIPDTISDNLLKMIDQERTQINHRNQNDQ